MKQKKKAGGSGVMSLVLMEVKKGTFDKTKDSKDRRKDRRKEGKKVQNSTE
ncbi:hypothetical protein AGMMS50222_05740 [Endomicrobiia bacterium]|nr:hypothetical protein AGMMS49531_11090 [Endomicrobiia bacterium]GHT64574.1 hypothetical protein AGMMS49556_02890 [Endomicrobiia bacterium]GHT70304.1 hypothetical protein AGMMS49950_04980 [Endomicrobiia bacterium]GHT75201.1 hypothetical protein AGMMS50222_05740 [Endomicrobiia bacterium]